jgi:hypothetical protein
MKCSKCKECLGQGYFHVEVDCIHHYYHPQCLPQFAWVEDTHDRRHGDQLHLQLEEGGDTVSD